MVKPSRYQLRLGTLTALAVIAGLGAAPASCFLPSYLFQPAADPKAVTDFNNADKDADSLFAALVSPTCQYSQNSQGFDKVSQDLGDLVTYLNTLPRYYFPQASAIHIQSAFGVFRSTAGQAPASCVPANIVNSQKTQFDSAVADAVQQMQKKGP